MALSRERKDPVRLFGRRIVMACMLVACLLLGDSVWNLYHKDQESAELNAQAQTALADLSGRQSQLQASIATLQTERGKEAALREQYDVGKPGEGEIVIIQPATSSAANAASSTGGVEAWLHNTFPWW